MSRTNVQRSAGRRATRQQQRNNRNLLIGGVVIGVLALLIVGGLFLSGTIGGIQAQKIPDEGDSLHLANLEDPLPKPYNSQPPTSGYHYGGGVAPWGIQTQPWPDVLSVHNLEHGGVIIHYRQGSDQATVDQLTQLARRLQQRNPCILLMPRPADQINAPIALTAWTYLLELQSYDEQAITRFFERFVGRGPEQACPAGAN